MILTSVLLIGAILQMAANILLLNAMMAIIVLPRSVFQITAPDAYTLPLIVTIPTNVQLILAILKVDVATLLLIATITTNVQQILAILKVDALTLLSAATMTMHAPLTRASQLLVVKMFLLIATTAMSVHMIIATVLKDVCIPLWMFL